MSDSVPQKLANIAVGSTWATWFVSNVAQINQWLQFVAFIAAITASILASRYYIKHSK